MIIVSSRKFRDNQNAYFEKANTEEVILQTLRYGSFRLVPVRENDSAYSDVRRASEEKNAALVANFHKGESVTKKEAPVLQEAAPMPAIDIAELVKAAVQEAVAAAVPAAAAAAAAAAQVQKDTEEVKPRASKSSRKSLTPKIKTDDVQDSADNEFVPLFVEEDGPVRAPKPLQKPEPKPATSAGRASVESVAPAPAPTPAPAPAPTPAPAPAPAPAPTPAPAPAPAPAHAPAAAARPAPAPLSRPAPKRPLSIEDELDDHEPIPEPSDEVKRHIHPVTEASANVKPDFIDPGLYTDYEDSYIVGEERPDLEAQLAAYRKPDKGGFFKRFFKK